MLRPERPDNYYEQFDLVPLKYRPLLQAGKVLVTNWHRFAPESEHVENGKSYAVVNKGPETPDTFARRVLEDLYDRLPIMVLNDEGHHCWRPAPEPEDLTGERRKAEEEREEARVWLDGLDRINNCTPNPAKQAGISVCVDLSATPFYLHGSGYPEGRPFPWIVTDFGLVDAIESGHREDPAPAGARYDGPSRSEVLQALEGDQREPGTRRTSAGQGRTAQARSSVPRGRRRAPADRVAVEGAVRADPGRQAGPGARAAGADPGLQQHGCRGGLLPQDLRRDRRGRGHRSRSGRSAGRGRERRRRSRRATVVEEGEGGEAQEARVYGQGAIFPELFSNTPDRKRTIRIDTKLLAEAESDDPKKKKQDAAEELRRVVATVGKRGEPGEHVRCVVSVSMLTEGWDANNVTQVLGVRAFGSQLLCEQVVGRGLRRMDYVPDPKTGLLTEEYVDVYGIPFW